MSEIFDVFHSYTSCACNKTKRAVDWGHRNIILYSACESVAIYCPNSPALVSSLAHEHKGLVTSVAWIRQNDFGKETEAVSCSTDKSVIVWNFAGNQLVLQTRLLGHTAKVTIARAVYVSDCEGGCDRTVIASASVDSTVKIWQRKKDQEFECTQTLDYDSGFALDVAIVQIPGQPVTMLACAMDNHKINLYVEQDNQFVLVDSLVGHEGWVQGLDFTVHDNGDILLASCSMDSYIRVWCLSTKSSVAHVNPDELTLKEETFTVHCKGKDIVFYVKLETILQGHDGWVHGIQWQPKVKKGDTVHQPICLLSASIDKTLIIWKPEEETGIWVESVRVGDVGGNTLGFYGAVFSPLGDRIIGHGYQGALHVWQKQDDEGVGWTPCVTAGGHFDGVQDVTWEPRHGRYLLSVSSDQTTRLHAYWIHPQQSGWYEIARPQVHGYDMQCLAAIDSHRFVSGADEKVPRIFEAAKNFYTNFEKLCGVTLDQKHDAPIGASLTALGLSNKGVYTEKSTNNEENAADTNKSLASAQYKGDSFSNVTLQAPPSESDLLQNTLWVETSKLYGHGYEIYSVAAHPTLPIIATACKASKAEHASVILWSTNTYQEICTLPSTTLTVTRLAFSHNGQHLLAVSRDRTWCLYQHNPQTDTDSTGSGTSDTVFVRVAGTDKKSSVHTRIIWDCAWTWDDQYFVTVSRDKKALMWCRSKDSSDVTYKPYGSPLDLGSPITAVHTPSVQQHRGYLVAFGLEDGRILIYRWNNGEWKQLQSLDNSASHHMTVRRLQFCPVAGYAPLTKANKTGTTSTNNTIQLASCGLDHCVRIYTLLFTKDLFT